MMRKFEKKKRKTSDECNEKQLKSPRTRKKEYGEQLTPETRERNRKAQK